MTTTERQMSAPAVEGPVMSDNTKDYYEERSRKAREMSAAAADPKIAAIHMEMAMRYDLLASDGPEDNPDRAPISDIDIGET